MTRGAITGFSQFLKYLFYDNCGVGHPIVKETLKFTSYPGLKAWEKGNRKKTNDQATILFTLGRYLIDHWTIESINWQPWEESALLYLDDVPTASLLLQPTSEEGHKVRVVPLPPGGGTRTRQGTRGHGLRTRRVDSSHRGLGTGDDIGLPQ
ncbi:hypothetical protein GIB67_039328 [Kingdonia uniflora]|uniref:Uncharacterized protein n=1 Tax=Kingdonia uniflora TaxID=39325 RepID=A0A7J7LXD1_9MAGN|nr:hypothetical protein GIB67_039328 [Kingdonia uniflora]